MQATQQEKFLAKYLAIYHRKKKPIWFELVFFILKIRRIIIFHHAPKVPNHQDAKWAWIMLNRHMVPLLSWLGCASSSPRSSVCRVMLQKRTFREASLFISNDALWTIALLQFMCCCCWSLVPLSSQITTSIEKWIIMIHFNKLFLRHYYFRWELRRSSYDGSSWALLFLVSWLNKTFCISENGGLKNFFWKKIRLGSWVEEKCATKFSHHFRNCTVEIGHATSWTHFTLLSTFLFSLGQF